jgi:transposase
MTTLKRPTYSAEFKLEAAQLVVDGDHTVKDAAESMNVSKSAMDKWVRQLKK